MDMEKLVALCRRKGFIFQSSEIYGGINGFWDYGPLGVELKKNIKDAWWQDMVRNPPPGPDGQEIAMVGLDSAIIQNPKVWEASGHAVGFQDPMVDCKACKARFRADQLFGIELQEFERSGEATAPHFLICGVGTPQEVMEKNKKKIEKLQKAHQNKLSSVTGAFTYAQASAEGRKRFTCPNCEELGQLTEPRAFNLMFKTFVGPM